MTCDCHHFGYIGGAHAEDCTRSTERPAAKARRPVSPLPSDRAERLQALLDRMRVHDPRARLGAR
mgnify:CR=1 FL=1